MAAPPPAPAPSPPLPASLPSSPAALLALVRSPAWAAAVAGREAALAASHAVLAGGCPWVTDRPLYAVALAPPPTADEAASTSGEAGGEGGAASPYTLRVRVDRSEAAGELDALLESARAARRRRQQGKGGAGAGGKEETPAPRPTTPPRITVSSLVDGIVVFAAEAHAEAFAAALTACGSSTHPAATAQVGAHELFRAAAAAAAVVVFVRPPPPEEGLPDAYIGPDTFEEGWTPPDPRALAAALRARAGGGEGMDG